MGSVGLEEDEMEQMPVNEPREISDLENNDENVGGLHTQERVERQSPLRTDFSSSNRINHPQNNEVCTQRLICCSLLMHFIYSQLISF